MKLKLLPVPHILITTELGQEGTVNFRGKANGPVIRIDDDNGPKFDQVYAHELEHVKQWYMTLGMHGFLYLLFKPYKQWAEVQAMKAEIKAGGDLNAIASNLSCEPCYELGLTKEQAIELLKD